MKKILFIMAMLWSMSSMAQIKSATLTASGLTCSMCSKAIFKALEKVPFVKSVEVDIERSSYSIQFIDGEKVVLDDLKKAVTDAGFSVASMQVTAKFDNAEIFNDAHVSTGGTTFHFLNVPRQVLQGDRTFTIIDKNYLPASEYKKYKKYTRMTCYNTGVMGSCCPGGSNQTSTNRIYHVTI